MPFELFPKKRTSSSSSSSSGDIFGTRNDGLDLRDEFDQFINGSDRVAGHGHWVVYRQFDRSTFSEPYNRATGEGHFYQITGEGVGGPVYEFKDIPVRVVHKDLTTGAARYVVEQTTPIGGMPISYRTYYLPYSFEITEDDIIYEIDYEGEEEPTGKDVEPPYSRTWTIQEYSPYRDKGGRIEYYSVICGLNTIQSEK